MQEQKLEWLCKQRHKNLSLNLDFASDGKF